MHDIQTILQKLGWELFYPDTMTRILFFRNLLRDFYSEDLISDNELDRCLAYAFGIYGQSEVYSIYNQYSGNKGDDQTFNDVFGKFIDLFKEALGEDKITHFKPRHYIDLFLEYLFSLHIKGIPLEKGSFFKIS